MLPIVHLFAGLMLTGMLFPFIGISSLLILFATYFIDVDHYFYCVFKHRIYSLKECISFHKKDLGRDELHIFHTIEFWILLAIASIYSTFFLLISIGIFYHLAFDFLNIHIYSLYNRRTFSLYTWIRRRI